MGPLGDQLGDILRDHRVDALMSDCFGIILRSFCSRFPFWRSLCEAPALGLAPFWSPCGRGGRKSTFIQVKRYFG